MRQHPLEALFHFQLNNPLWPDAQPYDTIFFVLPVALVVWLKRNTMIDCNAGYTKSAPDPREAKLRDINHIEREIFVGAELVPRFYMGG